MRIGMDGAFGAQGCSPTAIMDVDSGCIRQAQAHGRDLRPRSGMLHRQEITAKVSCILQRETMLRRFGMLHF